MTKRHKILVFIPPLLIGLTILLIFFTLRHQANLRDVNNTPPTDDYGVIKKIPPIAQPSSPDMPVSNEPVACTADAKLCPDGSAVGRTGPNCTFPACPGEEPEVHTCPPGSRQVDACAEIYAPVCSAYQVQCITTPCNPVPKTYSNSCFACMDNNVLSYTDGECTPDS